MMAKILTKCIPSKLCPKYLPNVIPKAALGRGSLLVPNITGSEWRKFVFAASQSYWRPRNIGGSLTNPDGSGNNITASADFTSSHVEPFITVDSLRSQSFAEVVLSSAKL